MDVGKYSCCNGMVSNWKTMSDDTVEFSNLKKEIRYYLTCIFCSYCRCECHSYTLSNVFFVLCLSFGLSVPTVTLVRSISRYNDVSAGRHSDGRRGNAGAAASAAGALQARIPGSVERHVR